MGQVTIYLEEGVLKEIRAAARREQLSVSRWVRRRLEGSLRDAWPEGYFDLFGALAHEGRFKRPPQPLFSKDVRREKL